MFFLLWVFVETFRFICACVNRVSVARTAALQRKLAECKEERVELYRVQGVNAQRLLDLNESLKDKERLIVSLKDEMTALQAKLGSFDELEEVVKEKDMSIQVLQKELTAMQLEMLKAYDQDKAIE